MINAFATLETMWHDHHAALVTHAKCHVDAPTADDLVQQQDVVARVRRAVDRLPARQARAMRLRLVGWESSAVGKQMGISDAAAKQLAMRAYRTLRVTLGNLYGAA
jgi:DNA-directed RNA polymerase specialized sigma24 family protein